MLSSIPVELEHAKANMLQVAVETMDDRGKYPDEKLQILTKTSKEIYDKLDEMLELIRKLELEKNGSQG